VCCTQLLRIKKGYYEPSTKKPVHVPGLQWAGMLLSGLLHTLPQLARFLLVDQPPTVVFFSGAGASGAAQLGPGAVWPQRIARL